jgi:uncharacterized membrane protein
MEYFEFCSTFPSVCHEIFTFISLALLAVGVIIGVTRAVAAAVAELVVLVLFVVAVVVCKY